MNNIRDSIIINTSFPTSLSTDFRDTIYPYIIKLKDREIHSLLLQLDAFKERELFGQQQLLNKGNSSSLFAFLLTELVLIEGVLKTIYLYYQKNIGDKVAKFLNITVNDLEKTPLFNHPGKVQVFLYSFLSFLFYRYWSSRKKTEMINFSSLGRSLISINNKGN